MGAVVSFDPLALMQQLHKEHPSLRFELSALSSEQILEQLASNRLDLGVSYLERLDNERFDSLALGETRMGLLYDQRFFSFGDTPLSWEALIELPLGMLTSGMHFRQPSTPNSTAVGSTPAVAEKRAVHQLLQAVHGGLCARDDAWMGGWMRSRTLRLQPIEDAIHWPEWGGQRRRRRVGWRACFRCIRNAKRTDRVIYRSIIMAIEVTLCRACLTLINPSWYCTIKPSPSCAAPVLKP